MTGAEVTELTPAILAAITPTSTVTHADADAGGGERWVVILDGSIVATFAEEDRGADKEEAAMALRGAIEERIAALSTRAAFTQGMRDLADFLDATPSVPLPSGGFGRHVEDADEFDAAVAVLGGKVTSNSGSPYEHCTRRFGAVEYDIQTNGRAAQQVRLREQALAKREAEVERILAAQEPGWALGDEMAESEQAPTEGTT